MEFETTKPAVDEYVSQKAQKKFMEAMARYKEWPLPKTIEQNMALVAFADNNQD